MEQMKWMTQLSFVLSLNRFFSTSMNIYYKIWAYDAETCRPMLLRYNILKHNVYRKWMICRKSSKVLSEIIRGRREGGWYIGIYTLQKSAQVNFLLRNNDVSIYYVLWNTMSIKILYLPKTNFWLRPWTYCRLLCSVIVTTQLSPREEINSHFWIGRMLKFTIFNH